MNTQKGFSLIEVLLYIAIIGIIIQSFISFVLSITRINSKTYVVQEVQANTRMALDVISQKIRAADDIIAPSEGNSTTTLVLDMPNSDSNLTFSVIDGALSVAEETASSTFITSNKVNVSSLTFTNLATAGEKDNIKIEIIIDYKICIFLFNSYMIYSREYPMTCNLFTYFASSSMVFW